MQTVQQSDKEQAPATPLALAAADFLRSLTAERGLSANTVAAYRRDLDQFILFIERDGAKPPQAVTAEDINRFLVSLHRAKLAPTSTARKIAALRTFFKFLCGEGILSLNPASAVTLPRTERRLPGTLTPAEV
ncbi:MAG TPA: site-specific integrase, partial [Armatimonadota bacterium]|nr:site-specific integrase [Armatimonadota bacterium]